MVVRITYECREMSIAVAMNNEVLKKYTKLYPELFSKGKVRIEWDDELDKVFHIIIDDPILEEDALKEWSGEGESFTKRYTAKAALANLRALGINVNVAKV